MNILKKVRDLTKELLILILIKLFRIRKWSGEISFKKIINKKISFDYLSNKLKVIYDFKKTIGTYHIDSTLVKSELCKIGQKFGTDKSPYNKKLHRHPYTSVYNLIFNNLKYKKFNFAEIGILNNKSIRMWREFFPNAIIYGFEFDEDLITNAKLQKLHNVFYKKIDVKDKMSIKSSFDKTNRKFDVIIDDSTHNFVDQINIIKNTLPYLNTGGTLIIEDIPKDKNEYSEEKFFNSLKNELKYLDFFNFIDCDHLNKFSKGWNNDRILILVKNNNTYELSQ